MFKVRLLNKGKSIIQLSLPTCLKFHKCMQESIWKMEVLPSILIRGVHFHQHFLEIFKERL